MVIHKLPLISDTTFTFWKWKRLCSFATVCTVPTVYGENMCSLQTKSLHTAANISLQNQVKLPLPPQKILFAQVRGIQWARERRAVCVVYSRISSQASFCNIRSRCRRRREDQSAERALPPDRNQRWRWTHTYSNIVITGVDAIKPWTITCSRSQTMNIGTNKGRCVTAKQPNTEANPDRIIKPHASNL